MNREIFMVLSRKVDEAKTASNRRAYAGQSNNENIEEHRAHIDALLNEVGISFETFIEWDDALDREFQDAMEPVNEDNEDYFRDDCY